MIFMYIMPVRSSSLPVNRADKYEEDGSRELIYTPKRQEDWEGSLGKNIDRAVSEFYLRCEGKVGFFVFLVFFFFFAKAIM